jgi:hypothetical protein
MADSGPETVHVPSTSSDQSRTSVGFVGCFGLFIVTFFFLSLLLAGIFGSLGWNGEVAEQWRTFLSLILSATMVSWLVRKLNLKYALGWKSRFSVKTGRQHKQETALVSGEFEGKEEISGEEEPNPAEVRAKAARMLTDFRAEKKEVALAQRRIREQLRQNRATEAEYTRRVKTEFFKGKSRRILAQLAGERAVLELRRNRLIDKSLSLDEAILRMESLIREMQREQTSSAGYIPSSPDEASRYIPLEVRQAVWERDQGRCVQCGAWGPGANIEFDHVIPFSKGGANTVNNLQLLCKRCNLLKSDHI